jgi:predicted RNA binding protein YcfA (HicA-like mRNA interferase family)
VKGKRFIRLRPERGYAGLSSRPRLWQAVLEMPRKIRELVSDLKHAGFILVPGGKGSHRKFRHIKVGGALILSGHDGEDAHRYQEKQVRNAIHQSQR